MGLSGMTGIATSRSFWYPHRTRSGSSDGRPDNRGVTADSYVSGYPFFFPINMPSMRLYSFMIVIDDLAELKRLARHHDVSVSSLIRQAIREFIQRLSQ